MGIQIPTAALDNNDEVDVSRVRLRFKLRGLVVQRFEHRTCEVAINRRECGQVVHTPTSVLPISVIWHRSAGSVASCSCTNYAVA